MKRARYDGGHASVEVVLRDLGESVFVERGHLLPLKTPRGQAVPASIRDELLERDDWTAVTQTTKKPTSQRKASRRKPAAAAATSRPDAAGTTPPAAGDSTAADAAATKEA